MFVSTLPVVEIFAVISPSLLSVAVAPCSVYVSPTVRLMVASPVNVITGASESLVADAFGVNSTHNWE